MKVRLKGQWEGWVKFFLKGIIEVSNEAMETAREIIKLKERLVKKLIEEKIASGYAMGLIDLIFSTPIVTSGDLKTRLGVKSKDTANKLIKRFVDAGILEEVSGKKRYQKYMFTDYVKIIKRGTEI